MGDLFVISAFCSLKSLYIFIFYWNKMSHKSTIFDNPLRVDMFGNYHRSNGRYRWLEYCSCHKLQPLNIQNRWYYSTVPVLSESVVTPLRPNNIATINSCQVTPPLRARGTLANGTKLIKWTKPPTVWTVSGPAGKRHSGSRAGGYNSLPYTSGPAKG